VTDVSKLELELMREVGMDLMVYSSSCGMLALAGEAKTFITLEAD